MQVTGQCIVIIPFPRGVGLAEPPPVVSDDAGASVHQRGDLLFPCFVAQWPPMARGGRLSGALIDIIDAYWLCRCFVLNGGHNKIVYPVINRVASAGCSGMLFSWVAPHALGIQVLLPASCWPHRRQRLCS